MSIDHLIISKAGFDPEKMKKEVQAILGARDGLRYTEALWLLQQTSALAELAQNADETGLLINEILMDHQTAHEFGFAGIIASGIKFLVFPVSYLVSYLRGTKAPPVTLTSMAKWAYSAVGLGLGIAIFMVPGALPVLAVAGSAIAGVMAITNFIKLIKERRGNTLQIVKDQLQCIEEQQQEKEQLSREIDEQKRLFDKQIILDTSKAMEHLQNLRASHERYKHLQSLDLPRKKAECQQKIAEIQKTGILINRSLGVLLACVGIVGATLLFFFPPVGMGILAATAAIGSAYTLFRIGQMLLPRLWNWIKNKVSHSLVIDKENQEDEPTQVEQEVLDNGGKAPAELNSGPPKSQTSDEIILAGLAAGTEKTRHQTNKLERLNNEQTLHQRIMRPLPEKAQNEEDEEDGEAEGNSSQLKAI